MTDSKRMERSNIVNSDGQSLVGWDKYIMSEQSKRSSYKQYYMGRLVDIQTALKPLKNRKNLK